MGLQSNRRIADVEIDKGGANYYRSSQKYDFFPLFFRGGLIFLLRWE